MTQRAADARSGRPDPLWFSRISIEQPLCPWISHGLETGFRAGVAPLRPPVIAACGGADQRLQFRRHRGDGANVALLPPLG